MLLKVITHFIKTHFDKTISYLKVAWDGSLVIHRNLSQFTLSQQFLDRQFKPILLAAYC